MNEMGLIFMDFSKESDSGLVLLMGSADKSSPEDRSIARQALRELHTRHYAYLLGILEKFAENVGTVVIDPEEFAKQTFKKAFDSASNFRDKSNGDPDKAHGLVRSWLGQIATNLAKDELRRVSRRKAHVELVTLDENHDIPAPTYDEENALPTESKALAEIQDHLAMLKPEEYDILMTYASFGFPTNNGRELPKDVRDALEERTGYERSNIRQKWRRLTLQLKAKLEPTLLNHKTASPCKKTIQSTQLTK
jgi:DNA-directed RNA polymerase specialized sigma24 family protein